MTITLEEIQAVAPDVTPKAQARKGIKNPFVTFESLESLCQGNETLEYCLHEMVIHSLRYTETVCKFEQIVKRGQASNEDGMRKEIESLRTAVHDSTIDSINLLSRNLKKAGKDNSWINLLVTGNRPAYMLFAMAIAFEVVLTKKGEA